MHFKETIALCFFIVCLSIGPKWITYIQNDDIDFFYIGYNNTFSPSYDEVVFIAPIIKEVSEGNLFGTDYALMSYSKMIGCREIIPPLIIGLLLKATGNLNLTYLLTLTIFLFLTSFVLIQLMLLFLPSKYLAYVVSLTVVFLGSRLDFAPKRFGDLLPWFTSFFFLQIDYFLRFYANVFNYFLISDNYISGSTTIKIQVFLRHWIYYPGQGGLDGNRSTDEEIDGIT